MCSKDNLFQKFEVSDKEFQGYKHAFLRKVDQYYQNVSRPEEGKDTKNDQKV
jgi:hypothetical protein